MTAMALGTPRNAQSRLKAAPTLLPPAFVQRQQASAAMNVAAARPVPGTKTRRAFCLDILPALKPGDSCGAQAWHAAIPESLRWVPAAGDLPASLTSQANRAVPRTSWSRAGAGGITWQRPMRLRPRVPGSR